MDRKVVGVETGKKLLVKSKDECSARKVYRIGDFEKPGRVPVAPLSVQDALDVSFQIIEDRLDTGDDVARYLIKELKKRMVVVWG